MRTSHQVTLVLASLTWATVALAGDSSLRGPNVVPPAPGPAILSPPVLVISFPDVNDLHNMGIASDGLFYYTCDGGNAAAGRISTFDLAGNLIRRVPCALDMRAIFWNRADGQMYAKTFERDLYRVDPVSGTTQLVLSDVFAWEQSSPALSPDGLTMLEHESGTIRVLDFATGAPIGTLGGMAYGSYPSNEAVAVSTDRIFTWDGHLVSAYDHAGNFVESFLLPQGDYGFSLKFVNGLLFASTDADYGGTGMWYGYNVGASTDTQVRSWGAIKSLYR